MTYMVKSNLVFLACHVNIVLMTVLLIMSISKSTGSYYVFFDSLQVMLYICGVFFNIYVFLYAYRKLGVILKNLKYYGSLVRATERSLRCRLSGYLKTLTRDFLIRTVILEASNLIGLQNIGCVFRRCSKETEKSVRNLENASKMQAILCDSIKTPELNSTNNLRPINKTKSDPIKKIVRNNSNRSIRAQSPELFKNKIYKSRMNLTSNAELPRIGLD